ILLLTGCATVPEKDVGDLTPAEQAEIAKETDTTSLAGKAVNFRNCVDPDSSSTYDKNSLLTKSTTTYSSGSVTDRCNTFNKGTKSEKTRLIEGTCKSGKLLYWYADCDVSWGKDYGCVDGKCVKATISRNIELVSNTDKTYRLLWYDGSNNKVSMPLAYFASENKLILGEDSTKLLVLNESQPIKKNDYFVLDASSGSYLLQYKGADAIGTLNGTIKFKDMGTGNALTFFLGSQQTIATIALGDYQYPVQVASDGSAIDFNLYVDLNRNGIIDLDNENEIVKIKEKGVEVKIYHSQTSTIDIHLKSTEGTILVNLLPTIANKIKAKFVSGCQLIPSGTNTLSCSIGKDTFKWTSSEPEGFVYTH
ncbi:MAG: hypothetical protein AABX04_05595, partial [Nanoarchaeota archaeon]